MTTPARALIVLAAASSLVAGCGDVPHAAAPATQIVRSAAPARPELAINERYVRRLSAAQARSRRRFKRLERPAPEDGQAYAGWLVELGRLHSRFAFELESLRPDRLAADEHRGYLRAVRRNAAAHLLAGQAGLSGALATLELEQRLTAARRSDRAVRRALDRLRDQVL